MTVHDRHNGLLIEVIFLREKQIEQKLVRTVRAAGGLCPKFVSPGLAGMSDRLILLPGGRFAFVEVKAPGEKLRALHLIANEGESNETN